MYDTEFKEKYSFFHCKNATLVFDFLHEALNKSEMKEKRNAAIKNAEQRVWWKNIKDKFKVANGT